MSLWDIARRHRRLLALGVAVGLLGTAASLAQPLVISDLIDAAGGGRPLAPVIALVAALFCADAALAALEAYLVGRAGENTVFVIRRTLTARLLRATLSGYGRFDPGDVFTRMVADTALARIAITQSLSQITTNAFMVVGGIVLMAWIDLPLLLLTLLCLGAAAAVSLLLARRVRIAAAANREDTSGFGAGLQRALGALTTVKASRAEERETERVAGLARDAHRSGVRVGAYSALLTPAMNVGTQVALTAVIGWGMTRVASGHLSTADLTAFMMYLFYLISPLVTLFMAIGQFQQGRAAVDRLTELGRIEQEEDPRRGGERGERGERKRTDRNSRTAQHADRDVPAVEFRGVTFGYGAEPVLHDVTFSVPARGLTALVGPSGAGKTTVLQLIERFHRPDAGTVRVAGADVSTLSLDTLRGTVGYVEQEHALLSGTVRENLCYAAPDAGEEAIALALDRAGLTEVVSALPDGLDTELGDRGAGLSGGQSQRLAIARTLLQQPSVVLLDEASAHLDGETEKALRRAVAELAQQCAVVTISHRMSSVIDADRIILLEGGRVRAVGVHDVLMAEDPLYRRLAGAHPTDGGDAVIGTGIVEAAR
ncbi:ABC transporter ATP-binding protein [Streptomyces gossypiisoli]|uniref:ABC transporter ATP-binding protein n=1 Tax=Streptomyces gossypiisoli TaxID=2748864 RepID=UPI0015DA3675|nr:ABC transporter ATP-binding protein [Streptomyces gossypiisoli]